jgi:hypothetical protein
MKKVIRRNVFETNSSSTHSVTIRKGEISKPYLIVDSEDNKVHVRFGEYGWGYEKLKSQHERLSYLCTMLMETEAEKAFSIEDVIQTEGFKKINEVIANKCNCDGIYFDEKIKTNNYKNSKGETVYYLDIDGYIDHQSCEDYSSINEFLEDWDTNIIDFIFNDNITVIIDNDNN